MIKWLMSKWILIKEILRVRIEWCKFYLFKPLMIIGVILCFWALLYSAQHTYTQKQYWTELVEGHEYE